MINGYSGNITPRLLAINLLNPKLRSIKTASAATSQTSAGNPSSVVRLDKPSFDGSDPTRPQGRPVPTSTMKASWSQSLGSCLKGQAACVYTDVCANRLAHHPGRVCGIHAAPLHHLNTLPGSHIIFTTWLRPKLREQVAIHQKHVATFLT